MASLRASLYTHLVLPACEPACRGLGRRLRRWRELQWLPAPELQERQRRAVAAMLQHAWRTSPFYRERFTAAGLREADLRGPAALAVLPPLTRSELRQSLDRIVAQGYPRTRMQQAASGGTTETPVPLLRDQEAVRDKRSVQAALWEWAGVRPGERTLNLWGAQADFPAHPSWRWRLYDQTLMRRRWLPTSRLGEERFEQYREALNQLRPRAIMAYPTPLQLFCEHLERSGRPYWRPRTAVCTAEAVSPQARQQIERTLGCPVFEQYGSREFGLVAGECEMHCGLHLNPLAAYVEFAPLPGAGAEGPFELLVTDLLNHGMPLIRYRINDCAARGEMAWGCGCGRGFPLLPPILGRTGDVFRLPDGSLVPGVALNRMPRLAPGIARIQMIQETLTRFTLRYVPADTFTAGDLDVARGTLAQFFPPGTDWSFEPVAEIPREASGKTRFCISKVKWDVGGGGHGH